MESPQGKQRVRNQPKPGANEFPSPLRGQNDEKYERRKSGTADDKNEAEAAWARVANCAALPSTLTPPAVLPPQQQSTQE